MSTLAFERGEEKGDLQRRLAHVIVLLVGWLLCRNSKYSVVGMFVGVVCCCCFGPAQSLWCPPLTFPAVVMMSFAEASSGWESEYGSEKKKTRREKGSKH